SVDLRSRFLQFVADRDMTLSYKPVFLLALLDSVNGEGKAELAGVARSFGAFYQRRREADLVVEDARARRSRSGELDEGAVRDVMVRMPFEKFERRGFVRYEQDVAFVGFAPPLWRLLSGEDLASIRQMCQESLGIYYERIRSV